MAGIILRLQMKEAHFAVNFASAERAGLQTSRTDNQILVSGPRWLPCFDATFDLFLGSIGQNKHYAIL